MKGKENPEKLILPEPSHIGYVTRDIDRTISNLEKYFGLEPFIKMVPRYFNKRCYDQPENYEVELAFSRAGNMVYEVIQVLKGKTIYEDFINRRGEGIHHLGYEVSDLVKWTEEYKRIGIEPIMSAQRVGLKYAYFNTPEIIVELIQRTPEGKMV